MWANNVASRNYDIICCCVDNFVVGNKNILFHDLQNYDRRNEPLALKLFSILRLLELALVMCWIYFVIL
jgi:hypothetical protein